MRVLQVIGVMDRGGAETMVMNLYRAMDRERIPVRLSRARAA